MPEADYVGVGELLAVDLGCDYTFLHPEGLEAKCVFDGNELVLPNKTHPGRFSFERPTAAGRESTSLKFSARCLI